MEAKEELPEDVEYIERGRSEDIIAACCNALNTFDEMDTALMSNADKNRVLRIKRKSIKMIAECIEEMYSLMFEDDEV